jgi:carboxymethylenebutenolidase
MFIEPEVVEEELSIATKDGQMGVYLARPKDEGVKRPAILLIQEIFGVNEHIRDVCRRYARQGYIVFSPDVFYREGAWTQLTDLSKLHDKLALLKEEEVISDLKAIVSEMASHELVLGEKIGVIGYCMGGRLSYLAAAVLPDTIKCAAVYYGGRIPHATPQFPTAPIERTKNIKGAVIGFFAGLDKGIPREDVEAIDKALKEANVTHSIYYYPDADHGFFNDTREVFHLRAAQDAWHKTLNWFEEHLGPIPPVAEDR